MKLSKVILGIQLLVMSFAGLCNTHLGASIDGGGIAFISQVTASQGVLHRNAGVNVLARCKSNGHGGDVSGLSVTLKSQNDLEIDVDPTVLIPCTNTYVKIGSITNKPDLITEDVTLEGKIAANSSGPSYVAGGLYVYVYYQIASETYGQLGSVGYANISGNETCGVSIPNQLDLGKLKRGDSGTKNFAIIWDEESGGALAFTGEGDNIDVATSDLIYVGGKDSGVTLKLATDVNDTTTAFHAFSPDVDAISGDVTVSNDAPQNIPLDSPLTATLLCY